MYLSTLKKQIENFKNGQITNNIGYIPLIMVEQFIQRKIDAFLLEVDDYKKYISNVLGYNCDIELHDYHFDIDYNTPFLDKHNWVGVGYDDYLPINHISTCSKRVMELISNDERTKQFCDRVNLFQQFSKKLYLGLKTNIGLFANIRIEKFKCLKIMLSDRNYNTEYAKYFDIKNDLPNDFYFKSSGFYGAAMLIIDMPKTSEEDKSNFYYYKDSNGERKIHFDNEETKSLINEELLGRIYAAITIDITGFSETFQAELRQAYVNNKLGLDEKKKEETETLRKMQVDRIMRAYELIKEAIELLNNAQTDLKIERIKMDNLRSIIFKNDGLPNNVGVIEFEDFFKNNMILRMLDLSSIDLTNVDIRDMDFSFCNIHIDPQTIFNKDMTNVNATAVKFSPFSDCFDGAILNGTIITDKEAQIDLDKLKSYNERTVIGTDTVMIFNR